MIHPPHAASIWFDNNSIYVEFPSSRTEKTHTITLPNEPESFGMILQIIKARTPESTVGTKGAPIQYDVDKMTAAFLKSGGKVVYKVKDKFSPEQRQTARDVLREIGLI